MSGSLSDLKSFVGDAFRLAPVQEFKPEDTLLGVYTFLPWVRAGVVGAAQNPPHGSLRATVTASLDVQGGDGPHLVEKTLAIRGPGDVLSFDEAQVVRHYPAAGTTNAEDSFLAHVEFDRPDFPWLFSPQAPAQDRLWPWIGLVVVNTARAELSPGRAGMPPRLRTVQGELQPLDDAFAWAHAQVIGRVNQVASLDDRLSHQHTLVHLSRLVCPRRLEPNTSYRACVVPIIDAGRRAALGEEPPPPSPGGNLGGDSWTLGYAWLRAPDDASNEIELPVFHSWTFQTGPAGDFESLARKLIAIQAPWNIGRRVLDASRPGGELPDLAADDASRLQVIGGPLVSPALPPADAPNESAAWPIAEVEALRSLLNWPDDLATNPGALSQDLLPRIGPELYAMHQAGVSRVQTDRDGHWFGQLNLAPTNRVAAGLGARVVERDREALMQSAWAQVGALEDTNRQIRSAQLARYVGEAFHTRHFTTLSDGDLVGATRRLHGRITAGGALTVFGTVAESAVAPAALSATFRRVTRSRGPLGRYAVGANRAKLAGLVESGGVFRDFQRPYRDLDGVSSVSEVAARALDPLLIAQVLQLGAVSSETAVAALLDLGQRLSTTVSVPDAMAAKSSQGLNLDPGFVPADFGAQLALEVVQRSLPPDPVAEPARTASHVALLRGLAQVGGNIGQKAGDIARKLATAIDLPAVDAATGPLIDLCAEPGGGALGITMDSKSGAFALASHGDRLATIVQGAADLPLEAAAAGLTAIALEQVNPLWPGTPVRPALGLARDSLLAEIHPRLTVTTRIKARLGSMPSWLPVDWFDDGMVQPIMAAPVFTRAMYQALRDYDHNWLIPGLDRVEAPDFVTLLETNPRFIEGFLVGLSHEMGRKLLWRGYPTDQRGTYFRRFWNDLTDELQPDIHRFAETPLGNHMAGGSGGRMVLLVRGELLRRYPDAIVLAMCAQERDILPPCSTLTMWLRSSSTLTWSQTST